MEVMFSYYWLHSPLMLYMNCSYKTERENRNFSTIQLVVNFIKIFAWHVIAAWTCTINQISYTIMHQCISLSDGDILTHPKYLPVALFVSIDIQFTPILIQIANTLFFFITWYPSFFLLLLCGIYSDLLLKPLFLLSKVHLDFILNTQ